MSHFHISQHDKRSKAVVPNLRVGVPRRGPRVTLRGCQMINKTGSRKNVLCTNNGYLFRCSLIRARERLYWMFLLCFFKHWINSELLNFEDKLAELVTTSKEVSRAASLNVGNHWWKALQLVFNQVLRHTNVKMKHFNNN